MARTKKSLIMNQVHEGLRCGRLLVLKDLGTDKRPDGKGTRHTYLCLCDCGHETIVDQANLRPCARNSVKSCGCIKREKVCKPDKISFSVIYRRYKSSKNAKTKGFDLSEEKFRELTQSNCYYCGKSPSNTFRYQYRPFTKYPGEQWVAEPYIYNGIDRVDSNLGYIESNCVPCCVICNIAKAEHSQQEFESWLLRAAEYIKKR